MLEEPIEYLRGASQNFGEKDEWNGDQIVWGTAGTEKSGGVANEHSPFMLSAIYRSQA